MKIPIPSGYEFDHIENNEIILKKAKSKFPQSWEELEDFKGFWINRDSEIYDIKGLTENHNRNIFAFKPQAEAAIALAQLSQLKAEYRRIEGGVIDWGDSQQIKHCIGFEEGEIEKDLYWKDCQFLAFLTTEARDHFFEHHRELIEKAKPLMVGE